LGAHPGSLGERNARNAPCPKPAVCPAQWRTARPARSHRLRSARNATRRPGGVGLSCWAIACGGGPPPKARKSCTGCACASGCGATMALWHGSVATDRRPARRPPSVKYVSHRNGAAASPPDTRTARRGPHAAREGALLVCFTRGVNTGMKVRCRALLPRPRRVRRARAGAPPGSTRASRPARTTRRTSWGSCGA
jgi:hypothetical protein